MHKPKVPDDLKKEVQAKADDLVEKVLKPLYIKPPPKKPRWNYPIDIWTKWNRSFFYFGSTWACPGPNAIAPTFEVPFARLEYVGGSEVRSCVFPAYRRMVDDPPRLTLDECLKLIGEDGPFTLV